MLRFCTHSELSCKSLEGQEGLRQLIFQVTCNMKDVGSTIGCQRLAGRLVGIPYPLEVGRLVGSPHPQEAGGWWVPLTPWKPEGPALPVRASAPPSSPCPEAHCCACCVLGPGAPV